MGCIQITPGHWVAPRVHRSCTRSRRWPACQHSSNQPTGQRSTSSSMPGSAARSLASSFTASADHLSRASAVFHPTPALKFASKSSCQSARLSSSATSNPSVSQLLPHSGSCAPYSGLSFNRRFFASATAPTRPFDPDDFRTATGVDLHGRRFTAELPKGANGRRGSRPHARVTCSSANSDQSPWRNHVLQSSMCQILHDDRPKVSGNLGG